MLLNTRHMHMSIGDQLWLVCALKLQRENHSLNYVQKEFKVSNTAFR